MMYQMRIAILMLLLLLPAYSPAAQYSEGACLLLQQQMERFSNQKQSFNYRNARYEYEKNCSAKPAAKPKAALKPQPEVSVVATPTPTQQAETASVQATGTEQTTAQEVNRGTEQDTLPEHTSLSVNTPEVQHKADKPAAAEPIAEVKGDEAGAESAVGPASADAAAAHNAGQRKVPVTAPTVVTTTEESLLEAVLQSWILNLPLIAANIVAIMLLAFLITSWCGLNLPGFKGVFAEYKLNRLLRWRLKAPYTHFRKLQLYNAKDERVVIDHLVLSPYGIFVISVQNYRGQISGAETQANWTRLYLGNKKQFMNPLHQNFKNTEAVRHFLQIKPAGMEQLFSVVAFSRLVKFGTQMPAHLCYLDKVSDYIRQFNEPCFDAEQLTRFQALLLQASKGR